MQTETMPSGKSLQEIPLLTHLDIECRIQSVKQAKSGAVGAILLLYKDARVDMRILDQVYGSGNWQRTHEVINGNLFCNIDIWDAEKQCWVRKQDVGTESNTEKEKGQASDAFKRAGFNIGIGRELYTAPFIYVVLYEDEYYTQGTSVKCAATVKFAVSHIGYNDRREITQLVVVDRRGNVRFDMLSKVTTAPQKNTNRKESPTAKQPSQQQDSKSSACSCCHNSITSAEQQYSLNRYGRELCRSCQSKAVAS